MFQLLNPFLRKQPAMQSNLNYFQALGISFESASTSLHCSMGYKGLRLLRQFEGCELKPYQCPANFWTVGFGHLIDTKLNFNYGIKISQNEVELLLYLDANKSLEAALRLTPRNMQSAQKDAIACFIFNLGAGAYQRSNLRKAILRGEDAAIQQEWMRWVWAGGRKLPGLARRRAAEHALFISAEN